MGSSDQDGGLVNQKDQLRGESKLELRASLTSREGMGLVAESSHRASDQSVMPTE